MSTTIDVRVVPEPAQPPPSAPDRAVVPAPRTPAHDALGPATTRRDEAAPAPVAWRRVRSTAPQPSRRVPPAAGSPVAGSPAAACTPEVVRLGGAWLASYSHAPPEPAAVESPVPLPALPPGTVPGGAGTLDARQACCMVAIAAVEVLAGTRPLAQLARWVTPEVYDALSRRAALTAPRARVLDPVAPRRTAGEDVVGDGVPRTGPRRPCVRRVRACPAGEHAVEASVVVAHADRVRAVAVRLTRASGRWRAAALVVG